MRGVVYHCGTCPYLPDREFHAFHPIPNPPPEPSYRQLMDWRFRRSGSHLYMPMCPSCDACQPIRVDVAAFAPRADQRRCTTRNADLTVSWMERGLDAERLELYRRYQDRIHHKPVEEDPAAFLVEDGGVPGGELHARDATGRLLAVSVCDRIDDALSSVYCYYDPDQARRSLGTFMCLAEIAHCRSVGLNWLYLGFLVRGCAKMEYKARFAPHDVLENGLWKRYASPAAPAVTE
ncbi:MAG: arginyltransferase [Planctomycetes bacterium]|nr:arginyltransferase [Planctomycetota bacterium]